MHGADLGADDPDEVVSCLVTGNLLAWIGSQVNAPLHHKLEDQFLDLEVLLLHYLLLGANRVKMTRIASIELRQVFAHKLYVHIAHLKVLII